MLPVTSVTDLQSAAEPQGMALESAEREVLRLRATFASGRTLPLSWRESQIDGLRRLVTEREPEIAQALASDLGRSAHDSWFGDVASVVGEADYALKHLKGWIRPKRTSLPLALMPGRGSYRYQPLGTVLVIGPWNYPLYLTLGPMVGALAAGNCVIVKPSEHAPEASALMARLIPEYVDTDAISVLEGDAQITHAIIDQGMDHIFFTGGTEIGRKVMEAAAKHLTPVTLELGGKSPVIVTRNADLDVAARRIAWTKLINSGQTCIAPDYVLVEGSVRDELVSKITKCLSDFRAGEEPAQQIVNARQAERLAGLLSPAPGTIVTGGRAGAFAPSLEPTVVVDPDPRSSLMTGEIFGPILPIVTVASLDEAIAFVNARDKPLASYVFTNSKSEQDRVIKEIPAGATVVNHIAMHVLAPQLPFGGVGASGMGAYHGKWGYEAFSHRKSVLVKRAKPDLKLVYPPYSERTKKILRRLA
jgi:aldehyde dehydrogenase (NAD+)